MSALRVCLVSRDEPGTTGTSRYAAELASRLPGHGVDVTQVGTTPHGRGARVLGHTRRLGIDAARFLGQYPIRIAWPSADVYHLTSQTYASALWAAPPPGPVLVTVHDVIPLLVRRDPTLTAYRHVVQEAFDRIAMHGLRRADALLADSRWTKGTLIATLPLRAERVAVAPLGVDLDRFKPGEVPAAVAARYALRSDHRYVLCVGSEDPRKNLSALWRAVARLSARQPDVRLLKVGRAHDAAQRARLRHLTDALRLGERVRFLDDVPEDDLPALYNAAAVCAVPSLYEGFGLPVLEALACGTRVVCADTSALREVAGADTLLTPPHADGLADALERALGGGRSPAEVAARRAHAAQFSWDAAIERVVRQYRLCSSGHGRT